MGEYSAQKAINFDLDTKALKEYYCQMTGNNYTQAYADVRNFMAQNGFAHRQGSGYISSDLLIKTQVTRLAMKMQEQLPWILLCARKIDVTDIGKQYDLLQGMKEDVQQSRAQIIEQYSVDKYFDGSTIIDTEALIHDHPEIDLYDEQQKDPEPDKLENKQMENTIAEENQCKKRDNNWKTNKSVCNTQRAINFDLDTKALKEYYCQITGNDYTQAYSDIRNFMAQNHFIHRQGSGYISFDKLEKAQVTQLTMKMQRQLPWLLSCAKKIDLTYIRRQFDLIKEMKEDAQQTKEQTIDQYSAGTSSDGAIIIDEENLRRDHPEINLYGDEPSPQNHIKKQEEYTTELYNEHDSWDQER